MNWAAGIPYEPQRVPAVTFPGLTESKEHDPNHDTVVLRRGAWSAARVRGGIGEAAGDVGGIYKTFVERED